MNCKSCGQELTSEQAFCPMCGERVASENSSGDFVQSIRNDIGNSEAINMVKTKVNNMGKAKRKKIGIITAVLIVLIVAISIFANIHTCDRCGEHFFGKEYRIIGVFEDYNACRDCYREYYY